MKRGIVRLLMTPRLLRRRSNHDAIASHLPIRRLSLVYRRSGREQRNGRIADRHITQRIAPFIFAPQFQLSFALRKSVRQLIALTSSLQAPVNARIADSSPTTAPRDRKVPRGLVDRTEISCSSRGVERYSQTLLTQLIRFVPWRDHLRAQRPYIQSIPLPANAPQFAVFPKPGAGYSRATPAVRQRKCPDRLALSQQSERGGESYVERILVRSVGFIRGRAMLGERHATPTKQADAPHPGRDRDRFTLVPLRDYRPPGLAERTQNAGHTAAAPPVSRVQIPGDGPAVSRSLATSSPALEFRREEKAKPVQADAAPALPVRQTPSPPSLDLDHLSREIWKRFEARARLEAERYGRA